MEKNNYLTQRVFRLGFKKASPALQASSDAIEEFIFQLERLIKEKIEEVVKLCLLKKSKRIVAEDIVYIFGDKKVNVAEKYLSHRSAREALKFYGKDFQAGTDAIDELVFQIGALSEKVIKESVKVCKLRKGKRITREDVRYVFERVLG